MNCDCTEKISSLIDGELTQAEARELERHLLSCVECQEARADFLSLRTQINDFPVAFKPVAQREALDRILGNQPGRSGKPAWRWVFNPAFSGVVALLILGVLIAFWIYPRSKSVPNQPEEIAKGNKKATPTPQPRQAEESPKGRGQNNVVPRGSQPPSGGNKNKVPSKKREPLIVEPPQDNIARNTTESTDVPKVRSADAETMTAIHFQKSELLLRSFRNVRMNRSGGSPELNYEKKLAQQLVYQNMMLRREADASGDTQVASLLESLEPILLDIANLPDNARQSDVRVIKDRVERRNIVALLQVSSSTFVRALD
jgi:Putative zinc-finger